MFRGLSLLPSFALPAFRMICSTKMGGAAGPIFPNFISLEDGDDIARKNSNGFRFRLVSYNILAQCRMVLSEEIHYNDLVDSVDYTNGSSEIGIEKTLDNIVKEGKSAEELSNKIEGQCGNPNDPCVRLKRDCVGLLAAFKLKDPSKHVLIVANTHIYWDPGWADVKVAQVKYLKFRLSQFKEVISNTYYCSPSLGVVGGFNSTPGDEAYNYMTSADMRLCSLYGRNGGEPPFTNSTPDFTGTLD